MKCSDNITNKYLLLSQRTTQSRDRFHQKLDCFLASGFSTRVSLLLREQYWLQIDPVLTMMYSTDHNKFSGSLPPQLGKFLGVDLCKSTSTILLAYWFVNPNHLFGFSTYLTIVAFNQLSKNLPEALFTDQLSMLILNDNRLSGSLPESLLEASQLTTLWVWNNQLTGIIPPLNEILSSCKLGNNEFSDMTNGEGFCLF